MADRPPRVFISYSHDSDDHADRVLALADRLRAEGIDGALDQYETSPPEGWLSWMERQVRESDFVLVVCTEIYLRRAERREETGVGHGVTFESTLSLQHLHDAGMRNTRFIPVVFEDRDTAHIPTILRGASRYNISTENGYEGLYRHLTGQAETPAPDLGPRRRLPRRERQWRSPPQVADPELPRPDPPKAADAFLRALHASSELGSSSTSMTADRVNGLGEILGIAPRDLLEMVEYLQDKGLVKVHWGGSVSLTPTGKECAEGRKAGADAAGSVTIGDIGQGAHVAIHSPEAVVGYQATGHGSIWAGATVGAGAIRIEAPLGDLVAALQGLRTVRATLNEANQEPTRALEEEVAATVREVQQLAVSRQSGAGAAAGTAPGFGRALVRSDRSGGQTPTSTRCDRHRSCCDRQVARTALAGMTPARRVVGAGSGVVVSNRKFCTLRSIFLQNVEFSVR